MADKLTSQEADCYTLDHVKKYITKSVLLLYETRRNYNYENYQRLFLFASNLISRAWLIFS